MSNNCEICNSKDFKFMYKSGKFDFIKCRNCHLVFLGPRPSILELSSYYGDNYYSFVRDVNHPLNARHRLFFLIKNYIRRPSFFIYKYLRDTRLIAPFGNRKLLDVGCGCGEYMYLMRELGWDVNGVEASIMATDFGRKKYGLSIINNELIQAEFKANSFDLVTFWHTIEHLANPKATLLETHRILKESGKILIETPNIDSIEAYLLKEKWDSLRIPSHLFLFSPKSMKELCNIAGFAISKLSWVHTHEGIPASIFRNKNILYKLLKYSFFPINLLFDIIGYGGIMKLEMVKKAKY